MNSVLTAKKAVTNYKKKKEKKGFITEERDAPEDFKGIQINTPDCFIQAPRDFLLIGRVQKRNTRPLTVGEIMHRDR